MKNQIFYWMSFLMFLVIFEIGKTKKNLRTALIIATSATTGFVFFKQNIYLEFSIFLLTAIVAYFILKFYEKNKILKDFEPFDFHGKRGIVVEPVAPFKNGYVKIVEVIGATSCHIVVEKIHEY